MDGAATTRSRLQPSQPGCLPLIPKKRALPAIIRIPKKRVAVISTEQPAAIDRPCAAAANTAAKLKSHQASGPGFLESKRDNATIGESTAETIPLRGASVAPVRAAQSHSPRSNPRGNNGSVGDDNGVRGDSAGRSNVRSQEGNRNGSGERGGDGVAGSALSSDKSRGVGLRSEASPRQSVGNGLLFTPSTHSSKFFPAVSSSTNFSTRGRNAGSFLRNGETRSVPGTDSATPVPGIKSCNSVKITAQSKNGGLLQQSQRQSGAVADSAVGSFPSDAASGPECRQQGPSSPSLLKHGSNGVASDLQDITTSAVRTTGTRLGGRDEARQGSDMGTTSNVSNPGVAKFKGSSQERLHPIPKIGAAAAHATAALVEILPPGGIELANRGALGPSGLSVVTSQTSTGLQSNGTANRKAPASSASSGGSLSSGAAKRLGGASGMAPLVSANGVGGDIGGACSRKLKTGLTSAADQAHSFSSCSSSHIISSSRASGGGGAIPRRVPPAAFQGSSELAVSPLRPVSLPGRSRDHIGASSHYAAAGCTAPPSQKVASQQKCAGEGGSLANVARSATGRPATPAGYGRLSSRSRCFARAQGGTTEAESGPGYAGTINRSTSNSVHNSNRPTGPLITLSSCESGGKDSRLRGSTRHPTATGSRGVAARRDTVLRDDESTDAEAGGGMRCEKKGYRVVCGVPQPEGTRATGSLWSPWSGGQGPNNMTGSGPLNSRLGPSGAAQRSGTTGTTNVTCSTRRIKGVHFDPVKPPLGSRHTRYHQSGDSRIKGVGPAQPQRPRSAPSRQCPAPKIPFQSRMPPSTTHQCRPAVPLAFRAAGQTDRSAVRYYDDPYGLDELDEDDLDFIDDGPLEGEPNYDNGAWRKELRTVTGYDPAMYRGLAEGEASEASLGEQVEEELRSARVAAIEDAIELQRIQQVAGKKLSSHQLATGSSASSSAGVSKCRR